MSKYGVISGQYFPIFGLNTGRYGPEITPYFDTFHAVRMNLFPYTLGTSHSEVSEGNIWKVK